jgi:putative transposase
LRGKISLRLKRLLYDACKINRWWISELSVQEDHVHMIIQLKASNSVADTVKILKGRTSRVIRKEYPELEEFLLGDSFWANGYFAETVGTVNEEVIRNYVLEKQT